MVWRFLSDIAFTDAKPMLVSCREQLGEKDKDFDSKVSHSFKTVKQNQNKMLLFQIAKKFVIEKIDRNVHSSFLFLGNS